MKKVCLYHLLILNQKPQTGLHLTAWHAMPKDYQIEAI